jgi:hypothetical protein
MESLMHGKMKRALHDATHVAPLMPAPAAESPASGFVRQERTFIHRKSEFAPDTLIAGRQIRICFRPLP